MTETIATFAFPLTGLVTLFALIVYFSTMLIVRSSRIKFQIAPPTTEGPEEFRRALRTQANTVEQIILFLPVLWLSAVTMGDHLAAAIGVFWPLARIAYNHGYMKATKLRMYSFIASLTVSMLLLCAAAYGLMASL